MTTLRSALSRGAFAALLTGSALALSAPALAQEGPAVDGQAAEEAGEQGGIQDIVVTARKRNETTQDVPVAVTAISAATIQKYDLTSLERIAASTPSFVVGRSPSGSGATLVLRGIGSNTTSIGLEQSVAVIVDGAYYGQGRTINEGFFDLGRLEILKGPQALFFGKNATAGVVSITTADPGDRLEVIARAGYEFRAHQMVGEAIISSPLTDTLGVRLAVRGSKMNRGYFKQLGTDQTYPTLDRTSTSQVVTPTNHVSGPAGDGRSEEFYVRGTVKWEPTDQFTATIKANYGTNKTDNPAAASVYYNCPTGKTAGNPAIPCARAFQSSSNRFPSALAASVPYANKDGQTGNQYKSWAVNANLVYEMDNVTLTSVTNYNWNRNIFQFDADSVSRSGAPGVFASEWSTFHAFSEEIRALTSYDGPVNLMVGGYYQKTKRDYLAWTASGGLENSSAPQPYQRYLANSKDSGTDGKTVAGFGQVIYKPVDRLELTGGVRYTHETKDSYFLQPYSHPIRVTQGIFLPGQTIVSNQSFDDWSPEVTFSFKPTSDINIWGAYKTAYKSGGFSNSGILSPNAGLPDFEFDPEKARGLEGGIKTMLMDRQLRFNVTAYTYKYTNLQLDFFRSDIFAFTTINAGSARTRGVEVDFEFAPRALDGFDVHGSVNYNKSRYGNAIGAPCYAGQTRAQGCNLVYVDDGTANGTARPFIAGTDTVANRQNLKGQSTANAPQWTATLGMNYDARLPGGLTLGMGVDARYSDSYLASAFGNPATRQGSYVNLDATLRLRTEDDRWELAVIGKNLTNRWYATGGTDAPNTGSGTGGTTGVIADQIGFANLPRTVMVQATFKY
ncbi:TonB-dependent receptor [Novosphingobium aromaticivorans DSM 12444]|uniref:TonB-dependent receptor n=1 Tax=Novosphingobium aromaticivorans (strain ATCC 700278 / DSM 12444 / CCUG 56034 / CIP 105152 / NBRC 16084 / F199) TaxID=279238 RepID=Q2G5G8_NOVAD|nr:TonB-dependent receptor [Novosphingobium aromaticivorans]ABD26905.1 TonB-dependent receptor [Novosphingobium aromaticivorans DSM 12444]SCY45144.1 Outer membrane receptor proteins, mostly Fe transport [Novosphingobium aromaticivorans]